MKKMDMVTDVQSDGTRYIYLTLDVIKLIFTRKLFVSSRFTDSPQKTNKRSKTTRQ